MEKKVAIIITTYQKTDFQKDCLQRCLLSCITRMKTPTTTIIVLDDNHTTEKLVKVLPGVQVEKTKHPRCGEVNAYVWACTHRDEYDTFIYIHDSTVMLKAFPLDPPNHFCPLWYAGQSIQDNCGGNQNVLFMNLLRVQDKDCFDIYKKLLNNEGSVVFGGMAVFDKTFITFMAEQTNFLEIAHMLHTRHLRSFFERILYMIYTRFTDPNEFKSSALCGNIFDHKNAFINTTKINQSLANNPYILKVWQGR